MGMRLVMHRWSGGIGLEELLEVSDVVSLHCPLFPETRGTICASKLDRMNPSAFLLNTSRGPLVVEQDLGDALNAGRIAGAGVDVLCVEPPAGGSPLFSARNCAITPHIAWSTREARERLMGVAVENLALFDGPRRRHVVA